jgi:hypothetical protein
LHVDIFHSFASPFCWTLNSIGQALASLSLFWALVVEVRAFLVLSSAEGRNKVTDCLAETLQGEIFQLCAVLRTLFHWSSVCFAVQMLEFGWETNPPLTVVQGRCYCVFPGTAWIHAARLEVEEPSEHSVNMFTCSCKKLEREV